MVETPKAPRVRNAIKLASKYPESRKLAIFAKCYVCKGGGTAEIGPSAAKAAVRDCADNTCPLWRFRGWQKITIKVGKGSRGPNSVKDDS